MPKRFTVHPYDSHFELFASVLSMSSANEQQSQPCKITSLVSINHKQRKMKTEYFLKTERIGFRRWGHHDFLLAKGLWGDSNVTKLIDIRGQLTDEQVLTRLLNEIDCEERYKVQYYPIFLLNTCEHVGCCGLRPYDINNNLYEIGFHIRSNHWKKGYACEAARAIIAYAFSEMNVSSLFAGHNPNNELSGNILRKLGFTYIRDEFYTPTGLNHPSYLLLKAEYELEKIDLI